MGCRSVERAPAAGSLQAFLIPPAVPQVFPPARARDLVVMVGFVRARSRGDSGRMDETS